MYIFSKENVYLQLNLSICNVICVRWMKIVAPFYLYWMSYISRYYYFSLKREKYMCEFQCILINTISISYLILTNDSTPKKVLDFGDEASH